MSHGEERLHSGGEGGIVLHIPAKGHHGEVCEGHVEDHETEEERDERPGEDGEHWGQLCHLVVEAQQAQQLDHGDEYQEATAVAECIVPRQHVLEVGEAVWTQIYVEYTALD